MIPMETRNNVPGSMPLTGHLDELRRRLFWCLGSVGLAGAAALYFAPALIGLLTRAAGGAGQLVLLKPTEIVGVYVKIALAAGAVAASPVIAWHAWRFAAPAVTPALRRMLPLWIVSLFVLFAAGAAFAYLLAVPAGYAFLVSIARPVATPLFSLGHYVSFVLSLVVVGGLIFEMPAVAALLARAGIVTARMLRARRREAVFVCALAAAILTPTADAFTMLLFFVPMLVLYEAGILAASLAQPRGDVPPQGDSNGYEHD